MAAVALEQSGTDPAFLLLDRLTDPGLGHVQVGAVLGAVLTAAMLVVASSGWIVFSALDAVLQTGFSPVFSTVIRALPSGWGAVAVEAAARRDWLMTGLPLRGLVVLLVVLWAAWARPAEPGPPGPANRTGHLRRAGRPARPGRAVPRGAVYAKELRTYVHARCGQGGPRGLNQHAKGVPLGDLPGAPSYVRTHYRVEMTSCWARWSDRPPVASPIR